MARTGEDVGRQVTEWGREIVQGGYSHSGENSRGGRGRGRGRGRGMSGGMRGGVGHEYAGRNKRETLKMEMDFRDIEIDMLPAGMERRTLNQSTWDIKYVADVISACISFHNNDNFLLFPLFPMSFYLCSTHPYSHQMKRHT